MRDCSSISVVNDKLRQPADHLPAGLPHAVAQQGGARPADSKSSCQLNSGYVHAFYKRSNTRCAYFRRFLILYMHTLLTLDYAGLTITG